jgi:hypothetical protein
LLKIQLGIRSIDLSFITIGFGSGETPVPGEKRLNPPFKHRD